MLAFLFPITLFLSALLLFSIQPMVAKALLPVYGGTPAVWTVCMLFFQCLLLLSYGYAWVLSHFNKHASWRWVHSLLVLVSLFSIPLLFHPSSNQGIPEWSILFNLFTQLGLPLLVVAASAPLLQFAYNQTTCKGAKDPYFLYVASNVGSLLSLLLYPWLIERYMGLTMQYHLWSIGYGIYLALLFLVLFLVSYKAPPKKEQKQPSSWKEIGYWVFLAFIPCSLMLGVTLYITTDVAPTPLFWILPLALYLLSFVITFVSKPFISPQWVTNNCVFFLIFTIIGFILKAKQVTAWEIIFVNLLSFFFLALLCHRTLYLRRPEANRLTLFYFCLALGGVLAGIFNGILARHLFNQVYEYPLAILVSLLVLPLPNKKNGFRVFLAVLAVLIISQYVRGVDTTVFDFTLSQICILFALIIVVSWQQNRATLFAGLGTLFVFIFLPSLQSDNILLQKRSFYAVNRVEQVKNLHVFFSQSTLHGLQIMDEKKPINGYRAYYGGIRPVIDALKTEFQSLAVTIMGLGTGTMVCQFRDKDKIKVIEIDQQVIDIAKNPNLFTYLRDCSPSEIIKNDGRLAMEQMPNHSQQLLVLDAFNSDAIPVHLMTLEAFRLYKRKISEDGAILVNLSNRHLNLLPVMNAMGRSLDLMTFLLKHKGNSKLGQFDSNWVLLTSNERLTNHLTIQTGWRFVTDDKQFLWTDDFSNILPLLRR